MATDKRHIALIGFMASGKSTVGVRLARVLGRRFVDIDEEIASAHGPIEKIFTRQGESAFRRHESRAIAAALARKEPSVIATGGGAPTDARTRTLLAERSYRIFLSVSVERIERRLRRAKAPRPMLGENPTHNQILELYERRLPYYREAEFTLECNGLRERAICDALVAHVADPNEGTIRECAQ